MTKTKLSKFRKLLVDYSRRLDRTAKGLEEQTRLGVTGESAGNVSNVPMHLGDLGTAMFTQELNSTLLEHEEFVMTEVATALGRIDAGTYGVCDNCRKEIPEGRLEVVPYTRYCVTCADKLATEPAANLNEGRPEPRRGSVAPSRELKPSGETSDTGILDGDRLPIADMESEEQKPDVHAAGTAGGGTAVGGLAGTTIGDGAPAGAGLEDAMGSGNFDAEEADAEDNGAYAGIAGGAVGGTPAGKRASGGRTPQGAGESTTRA